MNDWSKMIYERLNNHARTRAIEWTDENVKNFIRECLDDGGIPMFKDRYAGRRFKADDKNAVLAICYAGGGQARNHQWFKDVPEKDIDVIESETGEWREFLRRE